MSRASVIWAFAALPIGFVLGLATAFVQAIDIDLFGLVLPVGLVLAALAFIVAIRLVDGAMNSRYGGVALAIGWLVATAATSFQTTAGDLVLQGDTRTIAYLISSGALGAAAASWPVRKQTKLSGH